METLENNLTLPENRTPTPTPEPPSNLQVLGSGIEIKEVEELKQFYTPVQKDDQQRNYHEHKALTSHYDFALNVVRMCNEQGVVLSKLAMKVDKIEDYTVDNTELESPMRFLTAPWRGKQEKIANRFFLIAKVENHEYKLGEGIETFLIARNSHDKRLPMQVGFGNKVMVCSNLDFSCDIAITARNSANGFQNFTDRFAELIQSYKQGLDARKKELSYLQNAGITEEEGLAFICYHASDDAYINSSRIPAVIDMFLRPEHRSEYQHKYYNEEKWTLWRLFNAYTYAHRGELVIDKSTKEPYPDRRRTSVTSLDKRKRYTSALWKTLASTSISEFLPKHKWHRTDSLPLPRSENS